MKICPKCTGEYQDWVTICPDCNINLIDNTPMKHTSTTYLLNALHNRYTGKLTVRIGIIGIVVIIVVVLAIIAGTSYGLYHLGEKMGIDKGIEAVSILQSDIINGVINDTEAGIYNWGEFKPPDVTIEINVSRENVKYANRRTFGTNDITRAQEHIPFAIILPTYLPYNGTGQNVPTISGPLETYNNEFQVTLSYGVPGGGLVIIDESNCPISYGNPELNYGLERIVVNGKDAIRSIKDTEFSFRSGDVYFVIASFNLPGEEVRKVFESLINQKN